LYGLPSQRGERVLYDGDDKSVIRADRKIARERQINMCVTLK